MLCGRFTVSDLVSALTQAAAEAMAALNPMLIAGQPENYMDDARAAVAAVLETLAAHAPYDEDAGFEVWHAPGLRGLASAVREDPE